MLTAADTAFSIAAVRAEEGLRPPGERLFEDPYAALFRAAGAHAAEGKKRFLDLPFFRDGIRLRTRFIDDVLAGALGAGIEQIVLLGAGFDARALRVPMTATRGARVFEIDLPDQLERKRGILASGGFALPAWDAYVPCDLTADYEHELPPALEARGFRRDRPALFIWEGVTAYIGVAATDRALRFMPRSARRARGSCSMSEPASSVRRPSPITHCGPGSPRAKPTGRRAVAALPAGRPASGRMGVPHGGSAALIVSADMRAAWAHVR